MPKTVLKYEKSHKNFNISHLYFYFFSPNDLNILEEQYQIKIQKNV